jgi:hypothetical protein
MTRAMGSSLASSVFIKLEHLDKLSNCSKNNDVKPDPSPLAGQLTSAMTSIEVQTALKQSLPAKRELYVVCGGF